MFFYVTLNIFLQQEISDQHGDAGLSTEESHDTAQTEQDDNQASGWSRHFAGIRQGCSQTIRPQGRLNAPVQEEGPSHGYDYGSGLQNRVTSTQLKEQITESCCSTQELQQLWNETESIRRRVV